MQDITTMSTLLRIYQTGGVGDRIYKKHECCLDHGIPTWLAEMVIKFQYKHVLNGLKSHDPNGPYM